MKRYLSIKKEHPKMDAKENLRLNYNTYRVKNQGGFENYERCGIDCDAKQSSNQFPYGRTHEKTDALSLADGGSIALTAISK